MTPRIRANDYRTLTPPALGSWTPKLTVSVVMPAYGNQEQLDLALAALAVQTYPEELLEVIVIDNGSSPPLRLPEIRPSRARLLVCDMPGRANARNAGLAAATGDVIHWMDSDVVAERDEVEAHMRWHHLAPYLVVTAALRFTTAVPPEPRKVAEAHGLDAIFEPAEPHVWIEDMVARTDGLTSSPRPFSVHIGGATSVGRRLFDRAGPMDVRLFLGQDTEMGYRLAQAGAVFIPDADARAYHLGPSMRMRAEGADVNKVSHALVSGGIPQYTWLRREVGRQWRVPWMEVVIDARGACYDDVRASVDGVLASTLTDLAVIVEGPFDQLEPERRAPLKDPLLDFALLAARYGEDGRVRLVPSAGELGAPFRLTLPAGWEPAQETLFQLLDLMRAEDLGRVHVLLDEDGDDLVSVRLDRAASVARAELVVRPGEAVDDAIHEVAGVRWVDDETYAFRPVADTVAPMTFRGAYRARLRAEAEVERLNKEVERLRGQVAKWRDESAGWRKNAVQFRREIGALRTEIGRIRRESRRNPRLKALARRMTRAFTSGE
ncbi:glycosyltransferase [Streptosporangiaceae bacterium NEAU-GS5]|nr:glycosyltransferase [Streptosporangiaceae bacterium NEAU-GS5]